MTCPKCQSGSSIVGYEVRGIYDGVLFWVCAHCNYAFPRESHVGHRYVLSVEYADSWNREPW